MKQLNAIKQNVAEIEDYHPDERWLVLMDDVPALLSAVEAVLDLHKPTAPNVYGFRCCTECLEGGGYPLVDWPCPTVEIIHRELGEDK